MESAREAVAWLERHATYTRTGHHSACTGEWRDGAGLTASLARIASWLVAVIVDQFVFGWCW